MILTTANMLIKSDKYLIKDELTFWAIQIEYQSKLVIVDVKKFFKAQMIIYVAIADTQPVLCGISNKFNGI